MSNQSVQFTTTLLQAKKTATGIRVPDELVAQLGNGKRPPVNVTINNYTYPSTVAVMDGMYLVPVSAEVREKAGIAAGDEIGVTLSPDAQPREVMLPEDFRKALEEYSAARAFFETLSNSNKKRFIIPIEQAKTPETKNKRIEKAIADLLEKKKI